MFLLCQRVDVIEKWDVLKDRSSLVFEDGYTSLWPPNYIFNETESPEETGESCISKLCFFWSSNITCLVDRRKSLCTVTEMMSISLNWAILYDVRALK